MWPRCTCFETPGWHPGSAWLVPYSFQTVIGSVPTEGPNLNYHSHRYSSQVTPPTFRNCSLSLTLLSSMKPRRVIRQVRIRREADPPCMASNGYTFCLRFGH